MVYEKLSAWVDAHRDAFLADLENWLSVPSVKGEAEPGAPFGAENRKALSLALEDARRYGFVTRDFDGYAGDITLGDGAETLGILCHLDVVPAGEGWSKPPFHLTVENDRLIGRGVMDDKGPALAALYAMRAVRDCALPLKDKVRLILGCDEETGMSDMRYYAQKADLPHYGFSPDAEFPVIHIEKGGLNLLLSKATDSKISVPIEIESLQAGERCNVVPGIARAVVAAQDVSDLAERVAAIAQKRAFSLSTRALGDGRYEIVAEGLCAHASTPHLGKNAAGMLLIALADLNAGGAIGETVRALSEWIGLEGNGESLGIAISDPDSGPLTCNLGILRYDGNLFSAQLDIRYPLHVTEETLCGKVAMRLSPAKIALTRISGHAPHHVPKEHKVVQGLLRAYTEATGLEGYAFAIGGGTYSRMMPNTVAFGPNFPGEVDACHMPDEYIPQEKMFLCIKTIALAIVRLACEEC